MVYYNCTHVATHPFFFLTVKIATNLNRDILIIKIRTVFCCYNISGLAKTNAKCFGGAQLQKHYICICALVGHSEIPKICC